MVGVSPAKGENGIFLLLEGGLDVVFKLEPFIAAHLRVQIVEAQHCHVETIVGNGLNYWVVWDNGLTALMLTYRARDSDFVSKCMV